MSKIKILPDVLSNKIAAGEVVERPASVVKELVENAIDARSTKIIIEIEKGGRALIRVTDNGPGMSHDDALLAIERYATSKIHTDSDLYAIHTLGFRGEALPSIAAVSKFTLTTKDESSVAATEVHVEGGKIFKVTQTGAPTGTMISVSQLFFNTPARRKFLKAIETEMAHIADIISCMALAWPQIQFRLTHNQKIIKQWNAVLNPFDRVVDVIGHDLKSLLYPINSVQQDLNLTGWISDPSVTRSTSQKIYIFVNGRYVKDRGIQYALFEGYRGRMMKGHFPVAVIFLNLPADQVDVNVHPTKQEVRFARQREVYDAVKTAVEQVWKMQQPASWREPHQAEPYVSEPFTPYHFPPHKAKIPQKNLGQDLFSFSKKQLQKTGFSQVTPEPFIGHRDEPVIRSDVPAPTPGTPSAPDKMAGPQKFSDAAVIGQFRNTYILCEQGDDLLVIDQHAAHERIVYERLKRRQADNDSRQIQRLMMPETIDLSFREAAVITQMLPDLNKLGLEIEHFGGNTFVVKSVLSILAERPVKPLITKIAETMDEIGYSPNLSEAIDQCLILMACHGAIRAHQQLAHTQIREILSQLDLCENPYSCPHGRPTLTRWPLNQFEKSFRRIR